MSRASRAAAPAAVRWTAYVGVAIVFAIACGFLSHWQFSRNADRAEQLALVAENYHAAPVPFAELVPAGGAMRPGDEWRQVRLVGNYLADRQLLARNRPQSGTVAYEVLVPLQLTDGRVLLIDRGWVPTGSTSDTSAPVPAPPAGTVTVIARLRPGEPLPPSGRSAPPRQLPSINLPLAADLLGADGAHLEQSAYGLMVSEQPAPATAPQPLASPDSDPGPFLSYAVQWILFAAMAFAFIWYVIRTERRHRREEEADAAAVAELALTDPDAARRRAAEGAARKASRTMFPARRDRDGAEEDALLDAAEDRQDQASATRST